MFDPVRESQPAPTATTEAAEGLRSYRRSPRWIHRTGRGKVMLVAPGAAPIALGGSAVAVWVVLDQPRTIDGIMAELQDLGEAPPSSAVDEALTYLLDAGLIELTTR